MTESRSTIFASFSVVMPAVTLLGAALLGLLVVLYPGAMPRTAFAVEEAASPAPATGADAQDPIERGRYLALAGNCASCHTVEGGAPMAGGLGFSTPFGLIYSTNITPDPQKGIGPWSLEDFRASMREGVRPNGEHLYPVFPYTAFTLLRDEDIEALYAYLMSLPPEPLAPPANELSFPFNQRSLMAVWKTLFFEAGPLQEDPAQTAEWNRGAYLVQALGHCSACHSPRNLLGAEDMQRFMMGGEYADHVGEGKIRPWSAPNLTGSQRGLGLWSQEDLAAYLGEARNGFLESFGPMNEVIVNSTRHLTNADIDAMAIYLKSLPPVDETPGVAPDPQVMGRGRTVYNLHCGTCHLPTGEGDPEMAPRLNGGSLVVQSANPASMINAILYAPKAPELTSSRPWRKPMEEFQWVLDDEEVAAVVTFIRNSWDNAAGAVSADDVRRQR